MKQDERFYNTNPELFNETGSVENKNISVGNIFDQQNVNDFIKKLDEIQAPYVKASYTNLESRKNICVYVSISLDNKYSWPKGLIQNSRYTKLKISKEGLIEAVSSNLPKFKKTYVRTQDEAIEKINKYILSPEKYDEGGNLDIQVAYYPASDVCESLDTVVPAGMAQELKSFNEELRAYIFKAYNLSVAEYVAMKLHYNSVDDLCYDPIKKDELGNRLVRFAQEQIDAIATAIYSHEEKGDAIIIADQTGVGKGRTAAGIIRYAILDKKVVPFFFTEKKHLINDIYRDLIDIGFDPGIIEEQLSSDVTLKEDWTEEEAIRYIIEDIKDTDDVSVDYDFPEDFDINWLREYNTLTDTEVKQQKGSAKSYTSEDIAEVMDELVDLYLTMLSEKGREIKKYTPVPKAVIERQEREAMKEGKMRIRPFFTADAPIVDKDGNIIYSKIGPTRINEILGFKKNNKGKWVYDHNQDFTKLILPSEFKVFMVPFSQVRISQVKVGSDMVTSPKVRFFEKYANNSVIIIDESHSAAGSNPDNPSKTFQVISKMVGSSAMTTYLSATYAKREVNMPLYAIGTSMRESGLSNREMISTFMSGGNALKEAVSSELTRNGQLLRREKQIQGQSDYYYVYDGKDKIGTEQRVRMDKVASLFTKVNSFQKSIHEYITKYRKNLPTIEEGHELSGSKEEIVKQRTIKALTFQMFNFFLLGLKIEQTTSFAIDKLKNGVKTVITVANTMESALKNMPKTYMTAKPDDRYKVGDTINNDFNLYIAYLLFYTMQWKQMVEIVNSDGLKEVMGKNICILDDQSHDLSYELMSEFETRYKELLNEILSTPTGVSIAPIDEIKAKIKKENFSIDEITGRQLQINFQGDDYSKGIIAKRNKKDTTSLVRDFNENKVDCLFINQSGATGISMHARPVGQAQIVYPLTKQEVEIDGQKKIIETGFPTSLDNPKEVKKRGMIVTQMELDINKEIQKLGRINRTGQVYAPEYTYIISTIPSENRLTALMEKKLRSLSANVSSNQEQSSYLFESDDFFSKIAIVPFNDTIVELRKIYEPLKFISLAEEDTERGVLQIKDFTKMLYFADYNLQSDFYNTFSNKLNQQIQEQKANGLYVGKVTKKDYKAKTIEKYPFYIGDENARTSFGRHSFLEKSAIVEYLSKNGQREVFNAIGDKLLRYNVNSDGTAGTPPVITFATLDKYKASCRTEIKSNKDRNQKAVQEYNDTLNKTIKSKTEIINTKKGELSKYKNVTEIVSLQEQLNKIVDELSSLRKSVMDASENDPAKLPELSSQMVTLKEQEKTIREKLDSFGDIKQIMQESKSIQRDIDVLEKDIEGLKKDIDKNETSSLEYRELMDNILSYIEKIGEVYTLEYFEEEVITINDKGEETFTPQKYNYKLTSSSKCVITGVSFPSYQDKILPSNVSISVMMVSDKESITLSKIHPDISAENLAKGKKSSYNFIPENIKYDSEKSFKDDEGKIIKSSYWNVLAKETYTGIDKTKYFVVGSLLKSFMLSKRNGLTGEIIKFTTDTGIDRIGIEVTDKQKPGGAPGDSLYKELDARYSDVTSLQYLIYYDGNLNNINKLMFEYVYHYLVGRLYELNQTKDFTNFDLGIDYDTKFIFQISSFAFTALVIELDNYIVDEINDLYDKIVDGKFSESDKITEQQIFESFKITLVTQYIKMAEAFAMAISRTGIEINYNNLKTKEQSDLFPNVPPNKLGIDVVFTTSLSQLFKTVLPIDIGEMSNSLQYSRVPGIKAENHVVMTYNSFIEAIKYFEEINQKPSFSIGSAFFEKQKHLYVLEQFVDKSTEINVGKEGEINFVPVTETDTQKQIDEMIDNLVKILA